MKVTNCPIVFYDKEYKFNFFWGCLVCRKRNADNKVQDNNHIIDSISDKKENIDAVNNPYIIGNRKNSDKWGEVRHSWVIKKYAKILTWLCANCYPLATLFLHFRLKTFHDAGDASMFYYSVFPDMKKQNTLCLPRAFFIATTSHRFKAHGTLFIGAFLPTVRMHAWVMEDGTPADNYDNQWIYYRPVMILS